ncbi:hypothetical protein A3L04_00075 [Thermococcus chitonophagus]|uniref:ABC-2 type transporter transmembrane domain-containing protein n=1 Tax=Thermococcus chitonophagus TaxID=54262 RepID=A0A2Z2N4S0_9EURY|nr:hypothetical protein A3L04_00075 [Thermococcus chitonophagus]
MDWSRILAVSKRSLLELKHDKRTLMYALVTPMVLMILFGIAFGGHVHDVKVIIVNEDGTFASKVIANLDKDTFSISQGTSLEEALDKLKNGECWAVLYFPKDMQTGIFRQK